MAGMEKLMERLSEMLVYVPLRGLGANTRLAPSSFQRDVGGTQLLCGLSSHIPPFEGSRLE